MKLTVNICDLDLSGKYYEIIDINFQKQPVEVLCEKSVLRNFAKFAEKNQCQSLFKIKFQAEACNFITKETLA